MLNSRRIFKPAHSPHNHRKVATALPKVPALRSALMFLLMACALGACSQPVPTSLEAVKSKGALVVVTRNAPTTYYEGPNGPAGIEYDMLKPLADRLSVRLEIVTAERFSDILPMLANKQAHIAATGLTVADTRQETIRFGPPYQQIRQQVVYRLGTAPPKGVEDLIDRQIEVVRGASYTKSLKKLKRNYPELKWKEVDNRTTEDLLLMVWQGLLEITIADSHVIALARQRYPELRAAFSVGDPQALAWAFPAGDDNSLFSLAASHLIKLKRSGDLDHLIDRYYGVSSQFDYINMTVYQARIRNRLPRFQAFFQEAADKYGIDWRLIAAIAYQESYWEPLAVSPTGVRGLMMLTNPTAKELGVDDRADPVQSIEGGSRYFRRLFERIPKSVTGLDRTWMALAAYNVGLRHLEDARILTQKLNRDPDRWSDVKKALPLLSERAWYEKTNYGYARGIEPVRFVSRIRAYYDVLIRIDEEQNTAPENKAYALRAPPL